jgi:hypothetical protein
VNSLRTTAKTKISVPSNRNWGKYLLGATLALTVAGCAKTELIQTAVRVFPVPVQAEIPDKQFLEAIPEDPQALLLARELRMLKPKLLDPKRVVPINGFGKPIGVGITLAQLQEAVEGKKNFVPHAINHKSDQMRTLVAAMRVLDRTSCHIPGIRNWGEFVRKSFRQVWFNAATDFCGRYAGVAVTDFERIPKSEGKVLVRKIDYFGHGKFAMICSGKDAFNTATTLVHEARHWLPLIVPADVAEDKFRFHDWDEAAATATERLFLLSHSAKKNAWMAKQAAEMKR